MRSTSPRNRQQSGSPAMDAHPAVGAHPAPGIPASCRTTKLSIPASAHRRFSWLRSVGAWRGAGVHRRDTDATTRSGARRCDSRWPPTTRARAGASSKRDESWIIQNEPEPDDVLDQARQPPKRPDRRRTRIGQPRRRPAEAAHSSTAAARLQVLTRQSATAGGCYGRRNRWSRTIRVARWRRLPYCVAATLALVTSAAPAVASASSSGPRI